MITKIRFINLIIFLLIPFSVFSQDIWLDWAYGLDAAGSDNGEEIYVDKQGNSFTTGRFFGTVDFDPGAGIFNLNSMSSTDLFIQALDSNGNFIWAKSVGGIKSQIGLGIHGDLNGNIYITGVFYCLLIEKDLS